VKALKVWLKSKIKNFLLFLIRQLDKEGPSSPILRLSTGNIFSKDIHINQKIVVVITFLALWFMLVMQIGVSSKVVLGIFILLLLMFTFIVFYFSNYRKKYIFDSSTIILISFITIVSFLSFQIFNSSLSPAAFPIAAFVVLLSLLVSVRVSLVYTFVMYILISVVNDFSSVLPILLISGSLVSIINVKKIRNRSKFVSIGVKVTFVMIMINIIFVMLGYCELKNIEMNIWYSMLNGFISVLVILALLPLLETLFSKTTNIKLIELADFNNPILKRLMLEAPGTYHHSLMTASIAEQAADAIGENSLLARVCSYYHDIGKLKNPEYFIENQNRSKNPHDELSPSMSGLVLVSHVKDGVAFAKQYKLDKVIIDAIRQHHGTSLIQYFYFKAIEQNKDIDERDFRYPGEKPTTKVSAILMVADSIEAISRTLKDTSAGKLKEVVEKVINNKFTDGQFSDCPITLKDLVKISESMTTTLCGMYHARIEYKNSKG